MTPEIGPAQPPDDGPWVEQWLSAPRLARYLGGHAIVWQAAGSLRSSGFAARDQRARVPDIIESLIFGINMRRMLTEMGAVRAADRTTQRDLLDRLSLTHREIVAYSLDLPRKSSAQQIAARCKEDSRLQEILEEISDCARGLLCRAIFDADGIALDLDRLHVGMGMLSWQHERKAAAIELERRGLAFAFITEGELVYHVPADLQIPLRRELAVRFAGTVRPATAEQWLGAPRRDLQDIAALWTQIARTPVPLTTLEGKIHTRSRSRLLGVLPQLDLPDPNGVLVNRRLNLALAQLRDTGYLRLCTEEDGLKMKLVAVGDLADGFKDATFERFPSLGYGTHGAVVCALMLSEALTGQSVDVVSFGEALNTLLRDSDQFDRGSEPPTEQALAGLLPSWLRGELQFGLTQEKLTAVHFKHCAGTVRSRVKRMLADQQATLARPANVIERREPPHPDGRLIPGATQWYPNEPVSLTRGYNRFTDTLNDPDIIQISTLDTPLREDLLALL